MSEPRIDDGLADLLRFENVAWYDDGAVTILDRRVYPMERRFVTCRSYTDVVAAIRDMVTQSAGPYLAASMGMVLAAHEGRDLGEASFESHLRKAAWELSHARPTTSARMEAIVDGALAAAEGVDRADVVEALRDYAIAEVSGRYTKIQTMGRLLAGRFPDGGVVMTQCYAETIVGMMLRACRERGTTVQVICPETRPYLQGARLTASVVADMGFDVTVVTDNMPYHLMRTERVDVFTSAADVITMDGHVVNKVGTSQIALAAHDCGIPYLVTGIPNQAHPSVDGVTIEERDHRQVLEFAGVRTTVDGVGARYPAFDVTPPRLVGGVVTDRGILSPWDLTSYATRGTLDAAG